MTEILTIKTNNSQTFPPVLVKNNQIKRAKKLDKRFTGRTKPIAFTSRPKFAKELKRLAYKENCYQIEILEKALEIYKREKKKLKSSAKNMSQTFSPYYKADFVCNSCQKEFKQDTAYLATSDLD